MEEYIQGSQGDAFVNSIIGEGTTLRGNFDLNGLLRIDGTFYGSVTTNAKVLVGKNGVAESIIIAGTVVIGGKVKGDIIASDRVTLLSTGELNGNIKTPRLIIEEGVRFDGSCEIIKDKDKLQTIREEYIQKLITPKEAKQKKFPWSFSREIDTVVPQNGMGILEQDFIKSKVKTG
jgi:cytoskeletal protein CcmA (bactofilin family)